MAKWTPLQIGFLVHGIAAGDSFAEIGKMVGRSGDTVRRYAINNAYFYQDTTRAQVIAQVRKSLKHLGEFIVLDQPGITRDSMRELIRHQARRAGVRVTTRLDREGVRVCVWSG